MSCKYSQLNRIPGSDQLPMINQTMRGPFLLLTKSAFLHSFNLSLGRYNTCILGWPWWPAVLDQNRTGVGFCSKSVVRMQCVCVRNLSLTRISRSVSMVRIMNHHCMLNITYLHISAHELPYLPCTIIWRLFCVAYQFWECCSSRITPTHLEKSMWCSWWNVT